MPLGCIFMLICRGVRAQRHHPWRIALLRSNHTSPEPARQDCYLANDKLCFVSKKNKQVLKLALWRFKHQLEPIRIPGVRLVRFYQLCKRTCDADNAQITGGTPVAGVDPVYSGKPGDDFLWGTALQGVGNYLPK